MIGLKKKPSEKTFNYKMASDKKSPPKSTGLHAILQFSANVFNQRRA